MAFASLWELVSKNWGPQLSFSCWICSGKQTCEGLRTTQVYHISGSRQFVLTWWPCPQISDCDVLRTVVRLLCVKAWRRSISAWIASGLEQKMGSSFSNSERQVLVQPHTWSPTAKLLSSEIKYSAWSQTSLYSYFPTFCYSYYTWC